MEGPDQIEFRRTRRFLMLCSLPQMVAVFVAVRATRLINAPLDMKSMMPEGTPFPYGTEFLFWLNDSQGHMINSLADSRNFEIALVFAATWLAVVFCCLWWSKDNSAVTRRWLILSLLGWVLVTAWIWMVLVGTYLPFHRTIIVMRQTPWWQELTWWDAVVLLWFFGVGVIVYRIWRRDNRAES